MPSHLLYLEGLAQWHSTTELRKTLEKSVTLQCRPVPSALRSLDELSDHEFIELARVVHTDFYPKLSTKTWPNWC